MQTFVAPLLELAEYEEIQKKRREKQGMIQLQVVYPLKIRI